MSPFSVNVGTSVDYEEVIQFLSEVYKGRHHDVENLFRITILDEPSRKDSNFIIAHNKKNEMIGIVRLVERVLWIDGESFNCAGISSVGVLPAWQGKGVCTAMMGLALKEMGKRSIELSILYGRKALDGFYSRFGYYGVGRYIDLKVEVPSKEKKNGIRAVSFQKEFLKDCMSSYEKTYFRLSGSVKRSEAVWAYLVKRIEAGVDLSKFRVFLKNGKYTGYGIIQDHKLIEVCIPSVEFSSLAAMMGDLEVTSISIHPLHDFFQFCLREYKTSLHERFVPDGGYMARIVHGECFMKKMLKILKRRVGTLDKKNTGLTIGGYTIDLKTQTWSRSKEGKGFLSGNLSGDLCLMIGFKGYSDFPGLAHHSDEPWMKLLFPYLGYSTSPWDEV